MDCINKTDQLQHFPIIERQIISNYKFHTWRAPFVVKNASTGLVSGDPLRAAAQESGREFCSTSHSSNLYDSQRPKTRERETGEKWCCFGYLSLRARPKTSTLRGYCTEADKCTTKLRESVAEWSEIPELQLRADQRAYNLVRGHKLMLWNPSITRSVTFHG